MTVGDCSASGKQINVHEAGILARTFKPGLRFKLLAWVISISLISILVSTIFLILYQRNQLIETAKDATATLGRMIVANLEHAMLTDDWNMANDLIQAVVAEQDIETLRVINADKIVTVSSMASEVGVRYDRSEPTCQYCHTGGETPVSNTVTYHEGDGRNVLLNVNLIKNKPACYGCHSPDTQVLGLLMIETPLTAVNNQLTSGFWFTIILALLTFVLFISLLVPLLNRVVLQPVEEISKGVAEISTGNLEYQVTPSYRDELGDLTDSLNEMRQQLKNSYEEIERREHEAITLYELGIKISNSLALSEVLHSVAEAARELLAADIGLVGLYDESRQEITIKAASGSSASAHLGMHMPIAEEMPGSALIQGFPIFAEANDSNNLLVRSDTALSEDSVVSILAVPLKHGEKFLGTVEVMARESHKFNEQDAKLLMRLAYQVAVSIENAQLYQQLHYMATLEERDRLAREIHDHLAQVIGYLNVRANMADELLAKGDIDAVQNNLIELKRAANIAYTDVREEIFNLRTSVSTRIGLLPTIHKYLDEYRTHYGVETELFYEDEKLTEFTTEVASQVLRIIQEALTNIRKHANAHQAGISFRREGEKVRIEIADNGLGFSPDEIARHGQQHYGLNIMRERAESVGGSLKFDTEPNGGTRVILRVPLLYRD